MSTPHVITAKPSPALLPRWANQQDGWVRAIVADILKNPVQASDADVDRYISVLRCEKKLVAEPFEPIPTIEEKQQDESALEALMIDALTIRDGVNALKNDAQIDFGTSLTVVFGENGSGKSGFVRVLKRAAGVRIAEEILPNFHDAAKRTPKATFAVWVGATRTVFEWTNEFGLSPLNRVSVFDSRGARIHVEDDLNYVYTPGELTLFPHVQNAIERVRERLDSAIAAKKLGPNTLLSSFDRGCSIYSTIETLGAATDLQEIRTYATLAEGVDTSIDSLQLEIDALKSRNVQGELKRARDRMAILLDCKSVVQAGADFNLDEYAKRVETVADSARRHEVASGKAFDGVAAPGILGREWQRFIQAGDEYLRMNENADYPKSGDVCAYCRQPLIDHALDLVKKYRAYCNNDFKKTLDRTTRELQEYTASIASLKLEELDKRVASESTGPSDIFESINNISPGLVQLQADIAAGKKSVWPKKAKILGAARTTILAEEARLNDIVTRLQASVAERETALKEKQAALIELKAKKAANSLLPQIELRVNDAKWIERATLIKGQFQAVLRSLTEAAKTASEELLNKDFERRFEKECQLLRAPSVTLNFPGRQGQVQRRKTVAQYKPNQVLSEGEQKALGLADFLAEVTAVPYSAPVVFDDPITSMDYRRIHEVCNRIIALSSDRQVIVFTHSIWFAAELISKANPKTFKYYDIRNEGDIAGVVNASSGPRVDSASQVIKALKSVIQAAEKADAEVKDALVEKGYEYLRNLCELVVEQDMFKGVVRRYEPNIRMTTLESIQLDSLQSSIGAIVPIFEKCCRYIASHSQPIETQGIRPTLQELKADYTMVNDAREAHKT